MKAYTRGFVLWALSFSICITTYSKTEKPASDTLKILTYNVHHCNPPGRNIIDVSAVANVVKQTNASIVALQEIDVNTSRSGKELNEAEAIAKQCGMYFCFGKAAMPQLIEEFFQMILQKADAKRKIKNLGAARLCTRFLEWKIYRYGLSRWWQLGSGITKNGCEAS